MMGMQLLLLHVWVYGCVSGRVCAELTAGTASHIIEFEISVDEAVRRFERYQFETCGAMHAHNLINKK